MIRHLHEYMFAVLLGFLSTGIWALGSDRGHLALPLGLAFAGLVSAYIYLRQMRLGMKAPGLLGLFFRPEDPTLDLPLAAMRTAAVFLLVFCGMIALLTHDLYTAWKAELASDSPQTTEPSDTSASGSPPPDATRELAAQVGALAAAIRALPASAPVSSWMQAPTPEPDAGPEVAAPATWSAEARLALPLTVRLWAAALSAAMLGLLAWLVLRALGASPAMAVLPAMAISATAGGVSFKLADKVSIERLLDCGDKACLSVQLGRGAAPIGLRALAPSPPFAVGAGRVDSSGSGCRGTYNSAEAWKQWQRGWLEEWISRRQPSTADVVVLIGSADRQALGAALQRDYESNAGLAHARAEAVRERLLAATAALPDERHRLQAQRVLLLTRGPAHTGGPLRSRSPACDDDGLREDRKVQVWLHAARQP